MTFEEECAAFVEEGIHLQQVNPEQLDQDERNKLIVSFADFNWRVRKFLERQDRETRKVREIATITAEKVLGVKILR